MSQLDCEVSEASSHLAGSGDAEIGRRQMIEAKLQEIAEDINENRKRNSATLAKFKQDLDKLVRNLWNDGNFGRRH